MAQSQRFLFFISVLTLLLIGVPAYSTTITFSELGVAGNPPVSGLFPASTFGDLLGNQLAAQGILMSTNEYGKAYLSDSSFVPGPDTGPFIVLNTFPFNSSPVAVLTMTFLFPLHAEGILSVEIEDTNAMPQPRVIIQTLGGSSQILQTWNVQGRDEIVQLSQVGVSSIQFIDNGGDGFTIDNLSFTFANTVVPEPGTFLLFGIGLVLFGSIARRARA